MNQVIKGERGGRLQSLLIAESFKNPLKNSSRKVIGAYNDRHIQEIQDQFLTRKFFGLRILQESSRQFCSKGRQERRKRKKEERKRKKEEEREREERKEEGGERTKSEIL